MYGVYWLVQWPSETKVVYGGLWVLNDDPSNYIYLYM